jgi:predicted extracellular nuclease
MLQPVQAAVSPDMVIRQVYGGGGNSGATYKNDFIELYNRGTVAVDITGWSVQYASVTGSFGTTNITPLTGTVAPGAYYLIQEAAGAGGTVDLQSPDATGSIPMSGSNGKVALVNTTTALTGTCPTAGVVDFLGFGPTANCSETTPTASLSNTTAALRNDNGATDTDNNSLDFTIGAPAPRTLPGGSGLATPASGLTGASTLLTVTVTPGTSPASSGITVTADLSTIGGSATQAFYDDATNGDVTAADNTFSFQTTATGAPASLLLPATITDGQSRSGATTIAYQITSPNLVVSSTNPADAATDVPATSTFAITFSESVNVDTDWYTFTCGGNPVASTASAAPATTLTITPTASLPYNTACTVTVDPAKVTSVSSAAALTGTSTWGFTTQLMPVTVTSTVPANGATGVAVDSTFEINFNQSVSVTGTWYTFTCNGNAVAATVAPAGPASTYTITPSANLPVANICTVALAPANITSSDSVALTGTSSFSFSTISPDGCPVPALDYPLQASIGAIQGTELTAAKTGKVTVKGILTNHVAGTDGSTPPYAINQYGFYIQDTGDGNPFTSDGLFVYTGNTNQQGTTIPDGSAIMISGTISEFNKGTQITPIANGVVKCGTDTPIAPVTVNLPDDSDPVNLLERFENMLVHLPQDLTIDQNYFQGRYGQITVSPGGRLFNPTNGNLPGTVAEQIAALNRRMIVLDDNNNAQNPTITPYLGTGTYPYSDIFHPTRAGDLILGGTAPAQGLTGILDQGATNSTAGTYSPWYRIQPTVWPTITRGTNLRTTSPVNPGGNVKVAGFNLLNYFTTLDIKPYVLPYDANNTPRGADTQVEFERQRAKTVAAIIGLGADVTGAIELENNGGTAISNLVDYLNLATAPGTYDYVRDNIPTAGKPVVDGSLVTTDYIKAAIIYKPMVVTPVGASVWSAADIFDRQPLAQTFKSNLSGETFTVVVNHFKSKGSCPASGDVDTGQGCWNLRRTAQATELLNFVSTLGPNVVAVGDYNAYGAEDPINTLTASGALINEMLRVPAADRYTYVFDGAAGYLDQMLLTPGLDSKVTGVSIWHLNADEASLIDYNVEYKQPVYAAYSPDPYDGSVANRASDHDPILIGLNLNAAPQVANAIPDQAAIRGRSFAFTFADNTFSDANLVTEDKLTYTADLESGAALPAWLQFNATTRTFSGTPPTPAVLHVRVTATDQSGASVSTVFTLTVKAVFWMPMIGR